MFNMTTAESNVKVSRVRQPLALGEERWVTIREAIGHIREYKTVAVMFRPDDSAPMYVDVSRRKIVAELRRQYNRKRRIKIQDVFGSLIIG